MDESEVRQEKAPEQDNASASDEDDAVDDEDYVSSEGEDSSEEGMGVQLGFLDAPVHPDALLRAQFPMKVGGKPVWLNPRDLPSSQDTACGHCQGPLRFLMQVKAALPQVGAHAFHRTLYVFVCGKGACLQQSGGVRIFRSQLPRSNSFYSFEPPPELPEADEGDDEGDDEGGDEEKEAAEQRIPEDAPHPEAPVVCTVCGVRGPKGCARCRTVHYCSKEHQKLHWKNGHSADCKRICAERDSKEASEETSPATTSTPASTSTSTSTTTTSTSTATAITTTTSTLSAPTPRSYDRSQFASVIFPQKEIFIEEEDDEINEGDAKEIARMEQYKDMEKKLTPREKASDEKEFSDRSWKDMSPSKHTLDKDKAFLAFQVRVSLAPEQILRYALHSRPGPGSTGGSSSPMWIKDANQLPADRVPACARCGSPRKFEFQIMPQLLYFLCPEDRETGGGLDFGVLGVWTCPGSCGDGTTGYFEEFVYNQTNE